MGSVGCVRPPMVELQYCPDLIVLEGMSQISRQSEIDNTI